MTTTLTPTSGGSIKTTSGNVYTLGTDLFVSKNGVQMTGTEATEALTYHPELIYRRTWEAYNGATWQPSAAPASALPGAPAVRLTAPTLSTLTAVITPASGPRSEGYSVEYRSHGSTAWTVAG